MKEWNIYIYKIIFILLDKHDLRIFAVRKLLHTIYKFEYWIPFKLMNVLRTEPLKDPIDVLSRSGNSKSLRFGIVFVVLVMIAYHITGHQFPFRNINIPLWPSNRPVLTALVTCVLFMRVCDLSAGSRCVLSIVPSFIWKSHKLDECLANNILNSYWYLSTR